HGLGLRSRRRDRRPVGRLDRLRGIGPRDPGDLRAVSRRQWRAALQRGIGRRGGSRPHRRRRRLHRRLCADRARAAARRPRRYRGDGRGRRGRGYAPRHRKRHGASRPRPQGEPPMIAPDLTVPIPDETRTVHFIGIGGSGISGLARMFLNAGIPVSGSDRAESQNTRDLAELGARVFIGHDAANLDAVAGLDTVVYTGAIWPENPEFLAAKERGLSVLHRSQALKYLIASRRLVSVAGAHGKTTSTGMIVSALAELGADPSFVNGGVIQQYGVSSRAGADDLFVIEADESDGTFLIYETSIALITNVDADHLDHYGSHEAFDDA